MNKKRAAPPDGAKQHQQQKRKYTGTYVPKSSELQPGMKGCLITCDVHVEREAIKEAFRLLEDLAELHEATAPPAAAATAGVDAAAPSVSTAGDSLQAELQALQAASEERKAQQQKSSADGSSVEPTKPFSVAQTGCNGNVFIRFSKDVKQSPIALVDRIFERAKAGGTSGGRAPHIIRMVPISLTCPSSHDIGAAVAPLTDAPLADGGLQGFSGTYRVEWRRRCNSDVDKVKVIDAVASQIAKAAPGAKVDLRQAECAVMAEVIKTTCCLAVLPRWKELHGYNLRACAGGVPSAGTGTGTGTGAGAGAGASAGPPASVDAGDAAPAPSSTKEQVPPE